MEIQIKSWVLPENWLWERLWTLFYVTTTNLWLIFGFGLKIEKLENKESISGGTTFEDAEPREIQKMTTKTACFIFLSFFVLNFENVVEWMHLSLFFRLSDLSFRIFLGETGRMGTIFIDFSDGAFWKCTTFSSFGIVRRIRIFFWNRTTFLNFRMLEL